MIFLFFLSYFLSYISLHYKSLKGVLSFILFYFPMIHLYNKGWLGWWGVFLVWFVVVSFRCSGVFFVSRHVNCLGVFLDSFWIITGGGAGMEMTVFFNSIPIPIPIPTQN